MNDPFERFYNTRVTIVKIEEKGAYEKTYTETELARIEADIQPYSGNLAEEQYGFKEECELRMFAADNDAIAVGNHIRHDGRLYRIVYKPWSGGLFGTEALLKEVADHAGRY